LTPSRTDLDQAVAEAEASGILPITSTCNVSCVFCSNRWNPPAVRVFTLPPRPVDDIRRALVRMRWHREIVIGESASRVSEGEPLTHPDFPGVVREIRRLAPAVPLKLTTNGVLLRQELARLLAGSGPVEVTLSLNTVSPRAYRRLHGVDHDPRRTAELLARYGVPFGASVVAVPAVTGAGDLARTARYLEDWGCRDCRVFVPGYTRFTDPRVAKLLPGREEVARLVERARASTSLPLTLEPPTATDLSARVEGVIRGSPADRAGLRPGDVVTEVEGRAPLCRVDAFQRIRRALRRQGRCRLTLGGRGETLLELEPPREGRMARPGLVMDRDVDPLDLDLITRHVPGGHRAARGRVFVMTSEPAAFPLRAGLEKVSGGRSGAFRVVPVASCTFGGSIASAGLLTVDDFEAALRAGTGALRDLAAGDTILLPPAAFDPSGLDLLGRRPAELAACLPEGVTVLVAGTGRPRIH